MALGVHPAFREDLRCCDGAVLLPIVAVILFLALYPQLALERSEGSVKGAVAQARTLTAQGQAQLAAARRAGAEGVGHAIDTAQGAR